MLTSYSGLSFPFRHFTYPPKGLLICSIFYSWIIIYQSYRQKEGGGKSQIYKTLSTLFHFLFQPEPSWERWDQIISSIQVYYAYFSCICYHITVKKNLKERKSHRLLFFSFFTSNSFCSFVFYGTFQKKNTRQQDKNIFYLVVYCSMAMLYFIISFINWKVSSTLLVFHSVQIWI